MVDGYRYIQVDENGRIKASCDTPVEGVTIDTEGMTVPEMPTDAIYDLYYNETEGLHWVKVAELLTEKAEPTEEEMLSVALERLSKKQREVIRLYFFEDLTLKEIGGVLGISEAAACTLKNRAVEKLQKFFLKKC